MQKAALEALDPRQVMIRGQPLMLLPMVQVTYHLGMVLVVIVDVTVTHPKMEDGEAQICLPFSVVNIELEIIEDVGVGDIQEAYPGY
ncbi:hypothetical protein LR48_Vigan641s007200 [Vigna angularis]|uniref:Uncharacterized protein n=1 Tax=Phaseolus angularis TaxID=3914 RepID=A0A0L9TGN0_PHAAN|nr:hypothetical protein LR48_Vigan641s007200 [Vigna angularis]